MTDQKRLSIAEERQIFTVLTNQPTGLSTLDLLFDQLPDASWKIVGYASI
jgi:hypothetical protein